MNQIACPHVQLLIWHNCLLNLSIQPFTCSFYGLICPGLITTIYRNKHENPFPPPPPPPPLNGVNYVTVYDYTVKRFGFLSRPNQNGVHKFIKNFINNKYAYYKKVSMKKIHILKFFVTNFFFTTSAPHLPSSKVPQLRPKRTNFVDIFLS